MRRRGALAALAAGVVLLSVMPAGARTDNRSKTIVMVHGLDAFGCAGNDGNGTWNDLINTLTGWGWNGAKVKLGYYECDSGQTDFMNHHGSHNTHYGGSGEHVSSNTTHNASTRIEHLASHFAWYVYDHYSKNGVVVDAAGHSMGGLIIRYAIARQQAGHADFPPSLRIEDVVTFGTPHGGTGWAYGCWWADQCDQMVPGSSFNSWLASNAQNPQGTGGTDWTNIGSYDDEVVSADSAVNMSADHKVLYWSNNNVGHSDYMHQTADDRISDVYYNDYGGTWYTWYDAPRAVRWSDQALYLGSW